VKEGTFTSKEGHLSAEGIWSLQNKTYWQSTSVPTTAWCHEKLCLFFSFEWKIWEL